MDSETMIKILDNSLAIFVCLVAIHHMGKASADCRQSAQDVSRHLLLLLEKLASSDKG